MIDAGGQILPTRDLVSLKNGIHTRMLTNSTVRTGLCASALLLIQAGLAQAEAGLVSAQAALAQAQATLADTEAGATPEEIAQQYPSLDLADLYSIISYYLSNREEVEHYLRERQALAQEVRRENERRFDPHGIRERLLARKKQ